MASKSKLVPINPKEIVDELKAFIKCPMDPALRKLLKLTVAAIEALIVDDDVSKRKFAEPEPTEASPTLQERIKGAE